MEGQHPWRTQSMLAQNDFCKSFFLLHHSLKHQTCPERQDMPFQPLFCLRYGNLFLGQINERACGSWNRQSEDLLKMCAWQGLLEGCFQNSIRLLRERLYLEELLEQLVLRVLLLKQLVPLLEWLVFKRVLPLFLFLDLQFQLKQFPFLWKFLLQLSLFLDQIFQLQRQYLLGKQIFQTEHFKQLGLLAHFHAYQGDRCVHLQVFSY